MIHITETIRTAAAELNSRIGGRKPFVGIVLGSGLDGLGEKIEDPVCIPFVDIPGFPKPTALGHKGNFICGYIKGRCVLAMQGRYHAYEGLEMDSITLPIRVMAVLGVKYLLVSNASGACNSSFRLGDLMLIKDHVNLLKNPLIGPNPDEFGPRFTDMTCAYDTGLQKTMLELALKEGIELKHGVYLATTGPSYETPAENRFFKLAGADAVGMSTVPEVITARHCGMRVVGISVVSGLPPDNENGTVTDEEEVLLTAAEASEKMGRLYTLLISSLPIWR